LSSEESDSNPETPIDESESIAADGNILRDALNRRTFFKSAALGTAIAAMYEGGSLFSPLAAYADNLSSLNCTANDVRIVGPGVIINEPCTCTGSFNAQVRFRVINNTGTTRYCVTVHFCPGPLPGGGFFDPGDVIIGDIPPKSDAFYTVTIPNYPCGAGLVCFGTCGPGTDPDTGQADCSFPKGAACPTGQCCTTISWDVNPGCPSKVISSKCRHQQVCIQGRGRTTLDCDTSATGVQTNCPVECGATTTLRLCTTEAASFGPFTFTLTGGGSTQTVTGAGPCADFTVGPITDTTTFTGTVTSNDNCAKSASVTLTTTPITVTLAVSGGETCGSGNLSFTASTGRTGCTYAFSVDGNVVQNTTSNTFSYPADPDSTCHTVSVVATCGGCVSNTASRTVTQCVTTTTGCTP
jgi:hypothetical protein